MAKLEMRVEGMTCQGCVRTVQKKLLSVPGVKKAEVNMGASSAVVEYDEASTNRDALMSAVEQVGYHASPS